MCKNNRSRKSRRTSHVSLCRGKHHDKEALPKYRYPSFLPGEREGGGRERERERERKKKRRDPRDIEREKERSEIDIERERRRDQR